MSDSDDSVQSDDEFEYDAPTVGGIPPSHLSLPKKVLDQHYDEAVEVSASDADSARSTGASPVPVKIAAAKQSNSISSNRSAHTIKGTMSNVSSAFDSDDDNTTPDDPTGFAAVPTRAAPPQPNQQSKPNSAKASPHNPQQQPSQPRRTPPLAQQQPSVIQDPL